MSRQFDRGATAVADHRIPLLLRISGVMAVFGVSERTVFRWLKQAKLTPIYVGGLVFVTADDVRRLIADGITARALRKPRKSASRASNEIDEQAKVTSSNFNAFIDTS